MNDFIVLLKQQSISEVIVILLVVIICMLAYGEWGKEKKDRKMDEIAKSLAALSNRPPEIVTIAPQLDHYTMTTGNIKTQGTFGEITGIFGEHICMTVEREWLNNEKSISCIPPGMYELVLTESAKYGMRYHLSNPNLGVTVDEDSQRNHCLFHAANKPMELEGCIAPGVKYNNDGWGVYPSADALKALEEDFAKTGVTKLEIIRG